MSNNEAMNSNSEKYRSLSVKNQLTGENGVETFEPYTEKYMNEEIIKGNTKITARDLRQEKHKR